MRELIGAVRFGWKFASWIRWIITPTARWSSHAPRNENAGRGVLTNGEHARAGELDAKHAGAPLAYAGRQLVTMPPMVPSPGVINRLSVTAFNEMWYRKAPRVREGELQSIAAYFHPLDLVGDWNRVYGRGGFEQDAFAEGTGRSLRDSFSLRQNDQVLVKFSYRFES